MPQFTATSQQALEVRFAEIWARGPAADTTIAQAFGPFESWMLSLGECSLLLHPAARAWFYFDRIHDTWEPTGFEPGDVTFIASGRHLGYRRTTTARLTCPHCGSRTPPGSHFCKLCGRRMKPAPVHCANCGFNNKPDSRFCTRCGAQLQRRSEAAP
jgi:hypothetical protein